MSYPLIDAGFTHWCGDLETHLIERHGVHMNALGIDRRDLMQSYYGGQSLFSVMDRLALQFGLLAKAG